MANEAREYLRLLRSMPCCMCGRPGPSEAHHHTGMRGKGQRAHDHQAMPLCHRCHMALHNLCGPFDGWDRERLQTWQDARVRELRQRFENEEAF